MMSPRPTVAERLRGRLAHRRPARGDDSGNTLIYALLFTTVIAVVIAAVLTLAGANLRTTVAVHTEATEQAAADGAAKVAINTLRYSGYNGTSGQCLDTGSMQLTDFYQPASGPSISTRVECSYDDGASEHPQSTGAGFALHALATGTSEAIALKANGTGNGIEVHGDVGSTGRTHIDKGTLKTVGAFTSASCVIDNGGSVSDNGGNINTASSKCNTAGAADPLYTLPADAKPDNLGSVINCTGGLQTFSPGVYNDTLLNDLNKKNCVQWFKPGVYWFNFNGLWTTQANGSNLTQVVAGAPSAPVPASLDMSAACPNPFQQLNANAGVIFVFAGNAHWLVSGGGQVALCAKLSTVTLPSGQLQPPIAIWGLKAPVTGAWGTVYPSTASDCVAKDKASGGCATFATDNHSDIKLYLDGATYAVNAWFDLDLRGSVEQYLVGGIVVRQFSLFSPASATLPTPLSSGPLPGGTGGGARTVVYLTVYVCPNGGSCPAGSGSLRLKAKVAITDPLLVVQPNGKRKVTVLSWSVQR